jgi:hypothetical protein
LLDIDGGTSLDIAGETSLFAAAGSSELMHTLVIYKYIVNVKPRSCEC